MAKNRIILVVIVCFSMAALAAQTPSRVPLRFPWPEPGMTKEEHKKEVEKWQQQERKRDEELIFKPMRREAWKRLLRISERQWKIIEPKCKREQLVSRSTRAGAGYGVKGGQSFRWRKPTEYRGAGFLAPKTPEELTEGEKIVAELIDLMRQESASDEGLRQKIDALQRAREKARKALPKAKQELRKVLTSPRQEAVLLLMGFID